MILTFISPWLMPQNLSRRKNYEYDLRDKNLRTFIRWIDEAVVAHSSLGTHWIKEFNFDFICSCYPPCLAWEAPAGPDRPEGEGCSKAFLSPFRLVDSVTWFVRDGGQGDTRRRQSRVVPERHDASGSEEPNRVLILVIRISLFHSALSWRKHPC